MYSGLFSVQGIDFCMNKDKHSDFTNLGTKSQITQSHLLFLLLLPVLQISS